MQKWILYTSSLAFAAYWASNLLLWFPWSYSASLGITLMLTVSPLLWAYIVYLSLKTYPGKKLIKGSFVTAFILLVLAIVMDYIFFGFIRKAMEELYHPSTFYGYGFLLAWPIILALVFKRKIITRKKITSYPDILKALTGGLICLGILILIIILGIEI